MTSYHCIIAGGGPAGMMAGLLLARAGLRVCVLEKHGDFRRDFRGDTIHPSTLELIHQLGWLDEFLALPHQRVPAFRGRRNGREVTMADFRRLPVKCRFMATMPQWDFLDFLARKAAHYPAFELRMGVRATRLLRETGEVSGVEWADHAGQTGVLRAPLVIAADGRRSVLREDAGLRAREWPVPSDALWFRLSRDAGAAVEGGHKGPDLVMIDRGAYWQCGLNIPKGGFAAVRAEGLGALRERVAGLSGLPRVQMEEIGSWEDVFLLDIRMDRLEHWCAKGFLCIGDAAHAMTPVGGVGVNLAIQDAVAVANLLARPLLQGQLSLADLRGVQRRRVWPVAAAQALQRLLRPANGRKNPPLLLRKLMATRGFAHLMGRMIGLGLRPERISDTILHPKEISHDLG